MQNYVCVYYLLLINDKTYITIIYSITVGRTEPNLNDLALVFKDKKISIGDLEEYVQYVEPVPFIKPVPQYPIPRESHLNFLKPGSREVLTRPVHIHEYLPPMYPEQEGTICIL